MNQPFQPAAALAIVGGGNMARAIVEGCAATRPPGLTPERLVVAEPDAQRRAALESAGARTVAHARELASWMDTGTQLLLAVKPQSLGSASADLAGCASGRVVISILAGVSSERVRAALGGAARVVRAMPNTPARIGQGCTAIAMGAGSRAGDEEAALRLFRAVGPLVIRLEEELLDAFTAVAASGPAYFFYLAEHLTSAARDLGLGENADRVVRQMIAGSAALLASSPEPPAALRAAVTSKGGTTEAAVRVLDGRAVPLAVRDAVRAARDRGRELGLSAGAATDGPAAGNT